MREELLGGNREFCPQSRCSELCTHSSFLILRFSTGKTASTHGGIPHGKSLFLLLYPDMRNTHNRWRELN